MEDCKIKVGDRVIWTDPDGGRETEYEVYDLSDDIVFLSNDYGECEALAQECRVIK